MLREVLYKLLVDYLLPSISLQPVILELAENLLWTPVLIALSEFFIKV